MQIIPTILDQDFEQAQQKIKLVKDLYRWIQIDVIDNVFTKGKTFELELLTKTDFNTDKILWEIHLMVNEPQNWLKKCLFVGAARVIGQVEKMSNRENFIKEVKDLGMDAGLVFELDSEVNNIPEETDVVLLMARRPGFMPFDFDKRVIEKIKKIKILRDELDLRFKIGVDGGVNLENINSLKEAGVDIVYCGSAIFNGNVESNIQKIHKAIK